MKRLLLSITSVMFVCGLNAQSLKDAAQAAKDPLQLPLKEAVLKDAMPKEAAVSAMPSYFNSPMMANPSVLKGKQLKSYTPLGWIWSTTYARYSQSHVWGDPDMSTLLLRPDTLVGAYNVLLNDLNDPNRNFCNKGLAATGFVFDPYSKSFDGDIAERILLKDPNENPDCGVYVTNYSIDTLAICAMYQMADDYDPIMYPDTLMVYLSYYNIFDPRKTSDRGVNCFTLYYPTIQDALSMPTAAKYTGPILQQGSVVVPKPENTVAYAYPLTFKDTVVVHPRNIRAKYIIIPVNYEVPVGCAASVIIKYLPGTPYSDGDTLSVLTWNSDVGYENSVAKTFYQNEFKMITIADDTWENYLDYGDGYNGRLMEHPHLRYMMEDTSKSYYGYGTKSSSTWNPNKIPLYSTNYYAMPMVQMCISQGTDENLWRDTTGGCTAVTEINDIVSKIYPNPANNQIKVELKNSGTAELSIFNVLGQVVWTETLNEMTNTVNVSSLNAGVYMLRVSQGGNVYTTKFTKE